MEDVESCLLTEPNICCAERFPFDFYEHFDDFDFQKSIFTQRHRLSSAFPPINPIHVPIFCSLLDVQLTKINRISDFALNPSRSS